MNDKPDPLEIKAHETLAAFNREYNRNGMDLPLRWQVHPATWARLARLYPSTALSFRHGEELKLLGLPVERQAYDVNAGVLRLVLALELDPTPEMP